MEIFYIFLVFRKLLEENLENEKYLILLNEERINLVYVAILYKIQINWENPFRSSLQNNSL